MSAETWALAAMIIALIVTIAIIISRKDIAYSLVIVWALAGIAAKQSMDSNIVNTTGIATAIILIVLAVTLIVNRLKSRGA
jgi:hypothetical protein